MEWVSVATFNEIAPAEAVISRFNQVGIPARIRDERKIQKWFMTEPLASIRLQVERYRHEEARRHLTQWHATDHVLHEAVHCPECGSAQVEYPQFTRKFILPSVGVFLSTLGFVEKEFYCEDCHFTWPVKQKVPVPTDLLGWPKK
jgi:truncated hemoglobin YjbI